MRVLHLPVLLAAMQTATADWPQFLGPGRDGVAKTPSLPEKWPSELPQIWTKPLGNGFAGPVIARGRVIFFHRVRDEIVTEAVSADKGQPLWENRYTTDYVDSFGFDPGPRAVPTIAGNRVFTMGPEGRVQALDLETGKLLWSYDLVKEVESPAGFFGRAPSPLVVEGLVICVAGGKKGGAAAGLVALKVEDGQVAWTGVADEAGYASPVLMDEQRLLAWMRNELWMVHAKTGEVLAHLPLRASMDASVNAATPVKEKDVWFLSAGYGVGANLLRPNEKEFQVVWQKEDVLDCHYTTPVIVDGHLYGLHGRQESGMTLRCVEVTSGKVFWEAEDTLRGGTLIAVGKTLLIFTELGELWVVQANPEKYERTASFQITRAGHRSHPAFAEGLWISRDAEKAVALRLAAP